MKLKLIVTAFAAVAISGCKVNSDSCPQAFQVPFESVEIPDSVKAGTEFIIDVKLYDYGCYTDTRVVGEILNDTVYLEAFANYDECDCPAVSKNVQQTYRTKTDTSLHNSTLYYTYMLVNSTKDSVRLTLDSVYFY